MTTTTPIARLQHRRTPTSRYVITYFKTEKGFLFGSICDLDHFTEDGTSGKAERRHDFPADAFSGNWYYDLAEYRQLNRASTALSYKIWDNHNKTHCLNDAKDAHFECATLTEANARLELELERTGFPWTQLHVERYVNGAYQGIAS